MLGIVGTSHVPAPESREPLVAIYELVDELPRGPDRVAAWNAYALQTYGDKLTAFLGGSNAVHAETWGLAVVCYQLAADWLQQAQGAGAPPDSRLPERLPRWPTPLRSTEQLRGMRETLERLRIHIAYDLQRLDDDTLLPTFREALALVDAKLETADRLWIKRPPPEIRGGIGDALMTGLDKAYALGQQLAAG